MPVPISQSKVCDEGQIDEAFSSLLSNDPTARQFDHYPTAHDVSEWTAMKALACALAAERDRYRLLYYDSVRRVQPKRGQNQNAGAPQAEQSHSLGALLLRWKLQSEAAKKADTELRKLKRDIQRKAFHPDRSGTKYVRAGSVTFKLNVPFKTSGTAELEIEPLDVDDLETTEVHIVP